MEESFSSRTPWEESDRDLYSYWIHKGFCLHQVLQLPRTRPEGTRCEPIRVRELLVNGSLPSVDLRQRQRTSKYPTWGEGIGSAQFVANAKARRTLLRGPGGPPWGARLDASSRGCSRCRFHWTQPSASWRCALGPAALKELFYTRPITHSVWSCGGATASAGPPPPGRSHSLGSLAGPITRGRTGNEPPNRHRQHDAERRQPLKSHPGHRGPFPSLDAQLGRNNDMEVPARQLQIPARMSGD